MDAGESIERDVLTNEKNERWSLLTGVKFRQVTFAYPTRPEIHALKNVSLLARAGQVTALVGANGCSEWNLSGTDNKESCYLPFSGKSTCLSLLLRFYEPSSGEITIDDRPVTDYNVSELRQNISVVSQDPVRIEMNYPFSKIESWECFSGQILFHTSIYENIRFGKVDASKADIEQAAREANAHDFIMSCNEGVMMKCFAGFSRDTRQLLEKMVAS